MSARLLAIVLFVVTSLFLVALFLLFFNLDLSTVAPDPVPPAEADTGLIDVQIEVPTVGPVPSALVEEWGRFLPMETWKPWGEPSPVIREGMGRNGGWALDPNGDGNYASGVVSHFAVDLSQGAALDFWVRATTSYTYWQSIDVGLSHGSAAEFRGIDNQPMRILDIHIGAETDHNYVAYNLGEERQEEDFTPLNDAWHNYRIEIDVDGATRFYRDGQLKFAPEERLDLELYSQAPVVIEGRSYETDVLIDDLVVEGTLIPAGPVELEGLSSSFADGHVISTDSSYPRHIELADLDGDGYLDVLLSQSGTSNQVTAWRNPGDLFDHSWRSQTLGKNRAGIQRFVTLDLDQDGDLDLASVSLKGEDAELIFWENDGTPFDEPWRQIDAGILESDVLAVVAADLDADGDMDLVTGMADEVETEILVWQNPGTDALDTPWRWTPLGATDDNVLVAHFVDLDRDGLVDLVSGGRRDEDYEVIAWRNDGTPFNGPWPEQPVGAAPGDVYTVESLDLDMDGDLDLVSGGSWHSEAQILLWYNEEEPFGGLWRREDVGAVGANLRTLLPLDVDLDGQLEFLSSSAVREQDAEILLWKQDRAAGAWQPLPVADTWETTFVAVGDLDQDGDPDLVSAGRSLLTLWENITQ